MAKLIAFLGTFFAVIYSASASACKEEIQIRRVSHCQRYLGLGSSIVLKTSDVGQLQECCMQLMQMPWQCRCENLREIVRRAAKPHNEVHQIVERANKIPDICSLAPHHCHIHSGVNIRRRY